MYLQFKILENGARREKGTLKLAKKQSIKQHPSPKQRGRCVKRRYPEGRSSSISITRNSTDVSFPLPSPLPRMAGFHYQPVFRHSTTSSPYFLLFLMPVVPYSPRNKGEGAFIGQYYERDFRGRQNDGVASHADELFFSQNNQSSPQCFRPARFSLFSAPSTFRPLDPISAIRNMLWNGGTSSNLNGVVFFSSPEIATRLRLYSSIEFRIVSTGLKLGSDLSSPLARFSRCLVHVESFFLTRDQSCSLIVSIYTFILYFYIYILFWW